MGRGGAGGWVSPEKGGVPLSIYMHENRLFSNTSAVIAGIWLRSTQFNPASFDNPESHVPVRQR